MPRVLFNKRPSILICAPDRGPTHLLAEYLAGKDFSVGCVADSSQAIEQIVTQVPDMVVLDADLPLAGGYEVCSAVRGSYEGQILFLGRNSDEAAQLLAFERGADDYIATPVSPALLTARISARLKRTHGLNGLTYEHKVRVGQLVLDAARREVLLAGQPIELTTVQFEVLWYLAKRCGRVVPRKELYAALYRESYNGFDRSVDVYVSRIRHLLGDDPESPSYLKTVRGVGYLFVGHES